MNIKSKIKSASRRVVERKNQIRAAFRRAEDNWVRRSTLFRDTERSMREAKSKTALLVDENAVLRERTAEIARRLCDVSVQRSNCRRRLRICVEINTDEVERGFLHGGDSVMIDCVGQDIGLRAAREIRRANFQRWET